MASPELNYGNHGTLASEDLYTVDAIRNGIGSLYQDPEIYTKYQDNPDEEILGSVAVWANANLLFKES